MKFAKLSSKIVLCFLTILFWGVAAGLSYIGATIFMTYERYGDFFTYFQSIMPAFVILAAAFFMFLIGVIGVIALFSENRCLLVTFFSLLTILLGLEIAGITLLFMYHDNATSYIRQLFKETLSTYGQSNNTRITQNFDFIQTKLQCCGELNYTDWAHSSWWYENVKDRVGQVPQSCCANFVMNPTNNNNLLNSDYKVVMMSEPSGHLSFCTGTSPRPTQDDNYFVSGCYSKIRNVVRSRFVYIAGIVLALMIIQFIGLVSTCILMFCRVGGRKQQPPYINIATHEDANYVL
jgi:hypothetical protein